MSNNSGKDEKTEVKFNLREDVAKFVNESAKEAGMNPDEYVEQMLDGGWAVIEFEETTGKVSLQAWNPDPTQMKAQMPLDPRELINEFRKLRTEFEPVSAGINYHKRFMLGGGFAVEIDDPMDNHQKEMRKVIEKFNKIVYQDYYNKGLRKIIDLLIDEALTVGCAGAEIVYEKDDDFDFNRFLDGRSEPFVIQTQEIDTIDKQKITIYTTRDLEGQDWKRLGGIVRIKIIEDSINRMTPFRDPNSEDLRYWILDRRQMTESDKLGLTQRNVNEETHLHPWQVLWITWSGKGLNMFGESLIKSVYNTAKLMMKVKEAMGKGYERWADKKFFFICGDAKRPWGKLAVKNFLKMMEMMIKQNWTGIPVPTGFDVKSIGGEVFDARSFLDFLATLIASGMNYPKDFLLQDTRGEDKEAWVAWQNTYGYNQEELREIIQNQLWEKEIWCRVGQEYRIPKQGVPKRQRERADVFIPKVQWRTEVKWRMDDRLKMLAQALNVANPVSPQLKLAVEKDIAQTLGLTNIAFPTYEELEKSLKEKDFIDKTKTELEKLRLEVEKLKLEYMLSHPDVITEPIEMGVKPKVPIRKAGNKEGEEEGTQTSRTPQPPVTPEQTEKRLEGGVSRMPKETEERNRRGVARPMGGTRQSKVK